ncbi:ABC transporter ATP-binding protein [Natranaerobius thermophilus]|uniref:ABC transporter related n=1 Tax=Natranaerobius thermophilus (strain ATCC BAA-1301 / DSM 18059 / JW/NM-WN-LF) TaxID=457570 RepID=B2A5S4_NATTJ|nr:ABC transporter ATP-binding protein [Natranaerobius thermophilus]ACB84017.1 ABC transporter related [Natranaerobius thermophilus JW/NM-WN-LF]
MAENILEMRNITKVFPGVKANDNVNLQVRKGEIHALVGENGAGKSTLMNILYGLYAPDEGDILYNGEKVDLNDPMKAIELGIGMVHQHFKLVDPLTVVENIILGSEPRKNTLFIDKKSATKEVQEISDKYGLRVDPNSRIENVSVGMQQRVEIVKILYRGAELLIFDEPTAVLTPQEIEELFEIFRSLKEQGKTIIFITHKLGEVKEISDRLTVLRNGQSVGTVETSTVSKEEVAKMMVGREVLLRVDKDVAKPKDVVLKVDGLSAKDSRGVPIVKDISLDVRGGEILGIAGVEGNGQTELIEVLTGLRQATNGNIFFSGQDITGLTPRQIKEHKIGHIPEDRQKRGLVLDFDLAENMILGYHYQKPFASNYRMNYNHIIDYTKELISEYDVRTPGYHVQARSLSGGNQQKVIIAREFSQEPELLIASQPTRGVDIGAIEFIHQNLIEQRDQGKAILVVSADLNEIMSLSDRIAVIYDGSIVDVVNSEEVDEYQLGALMTGSNLEKEASK